MEGHLSPYSSFLRGSNVDRLLVSLTPKVRSTPLPKSCIQDFNRMWNPTQKSITTYFKLRDLWKSYEKWSAYGAKTKVMVNNRPEEVDQFFVPSLSAIQIFTVKPHESIRHQRKKMSYESLCSYNYPMDLYPSKPYFEFHEKVSPYNRPPLFDTIENLSKSNPGLQTLTSVDLAPASWMCVAWYPICQIPNIGIPIKDFDAAFLTFHSLSSFYQDGMEEDNRSFDVQNGCKIRNQSISLLPFGCATYKLDGDIWLNHGESDYMTLSYLYNAADSWIEQLGFEHHDFKFFTRQNGKHAVAFAEPSCSYFDNCNNFWPRPTDQFTTSYYNYF